MRLEHLAIAGFKSFSDRAELAFDEGVTAIVGPNGCGKSNVADAITWVLGEQSAKSLRGDKMEDVIFGGSDARKPGATAEVKLRLAGLPLPPRGSLVGSPAEFQSAETPGNGNGHTNGHSNGNGHGHGNGHPVAGDFRLDDGQVHAGVEGLTGFLTRDVEVTRRLYRSGESEYLIDGEVCRLRDIHELLMDTGLGAKAYAIIEQGKIGMILSSRPTDRRQLIEEAAGITKYKSRRRSAELKLEAAQQNLTRIDDIVFEVEKQRGALKRQAAKARRYQRLRAELRRWEKVLFARRYRELAQVIEQAQTRLASERQTESAAAARLAEVESDLARLRMQQAEADSRATALRGDAHARELDISRRQHQQELNRHQADTLAHRVREIGEEIEELTARREPARLALEARRQAHGEAVRARDDAAVNLAEATDGLLLAQRQIEGLEGLVDAARRDVFVVHDSVTALRHAIEHALVQRERVGQLLGQLDVERDDLRRESDMREAECATATEALARARRGLDRLALERVACESELASMRGEHEWRVRSVRTREQELAGVQARLASLEEVVSSRAEFGDAVRMVLSQANGRVGQQGAVADYLEVDGRYERAVEACLGDLLQHVVVDRHEQAAAGLLLVREQAAGRCGFVVVDAGATGYQTHEPLQMTGVARVSDVIRITGDHASTIERVLPEAYIVESFEQAEVVSKQTSARVATLDGDVFRGPHVVSGGTRVESRGILATRREIKELRERITADQTVLARLTDEVAGLDVSIARVSAAIVGIQEEQHRLEKDSVGYEAQVAYGREEEIRLHRKGEVIALERRGAEEERASLEARHAEAEASVVRLEGDQRVAVERLSLAQRHLIDARGLVDALADRVAESRAAHAGLVERALALGAEVVRLEAGSAELEERILTRSVEREQTGGRREALLQAVAESVQAIDDDVRALAAMTEGLRAADDRAGEMRLRVDAQDAVIRGARGVLDEVRSRVTNLDMIRVTAQSDLAHLAQACIDAVQSTLDEVLLDVECMEQAGEATPDAAALSTEDPDPDGEEADPGTIAAVATFPVEEGRPAQAPPASMTAGDAITALKARIDRLGPVNMMAIDQFDELEARHAFLTTQRADLVDSIAKTSEAIARIDDTTKARFSEALAAIQRNFQGTFSTLFGGGHAGLTLLDEGDPLDSGIEIVASPPGKRLQSVQLLSGGEKALTAIALMFAIFQYKPSPFCLLDEIDAPLDDANVGRFVEMLHGMLDRTQFILITHNRRTMEIANRLYGVTMEEPGVSKLISVQLN